MDVVRNECDLSTLRTSPFPQSTHFITILGGLQLLLDDLPVFLSFHPLASPFLNTRRFRRDPSPNFNSYPPTLAIFCRWRSYPSVDPDLNRYCDCPRPKAPSSSLRSIHALNNH